MEMDAGTLATNFGGSRGLPASVRIRSTLREQIINMHLLPGAPISEKYVSDFYRVSRTPVRDALVRLAEERLVEIYPQRGTFVSRISIGAVRDVMVMRKALERVTARDAAARPNTAHLLELRAVLDRQRAYDRAGDLAAFHAADDDFHQLIAIMGEHANLWRIVKSEKAPAERCRVLAIPASDRRKLVISQHGAIVDAIARGRPEAAETAMDAHLADVLPGLDELRRAYPDYFESETGDRLGRQLPRPDANGAFGGSSSHRGGSNREKATP
jgi:GntR family transcriptional regulator, rspAB operon transcriptional repressor